MANESVLVVDDEPEIGSIVARALQRHAYRVLTASSGAEALDIVEAENGAVDLVITDLVMPGMGGRELVWQIQQRYPGLCVVLLSGYADMEGALQMMDSTPSVFLEKPVDLALLASTVRELLDQRSC